MKYYLIAGEASGDLHGSNLMHELKIADPAAEFRFWGGDLMQKAGGENVSHYKERAFMGFLEVVKNLPTVTGFIKKCKKDLLEHRPDVLILIDYPGFNLRIASFAKKHGIRVCYYISPQIWAWKESRIHEIKANVDRMYVILPFEKTFYRKHDYPVEFVGHPLLDALKGVEAEENFVSRVSLSGKPVIALLPGSRKQEIWKKLPVMASIRPFFPKYEFIVAGAPGIPESFYHEIPECKDLRVISNETYQLLLHSEAALVTSGTATLETALLEIPEVVCYKGSKISYWIAKKLIKVKYISLVNLIMDHEVVKELIQDELNTENLKKELGKIIIGGIKRRKLLDEYKELKKILGETGASKKTAQSIFAYLSK